MKIFLPLPNQTNWTPGRVAVLRQVLLPEYLSSTATLPRWERRACRAQGLREGWLRRAGGAIGDVQVEAV